MVIAALTFALSSLLSPSVFAATPVSIKKVSDRRAILILEKEDVEKIKEKDSLVLAPAESFLLEDDTLGDSLGRTHRLSFGLEVYSGEQSADINILGADDTDESEGLLTSLTVDYARNFRIFEIGANVDYQLSTTENDDDIKSNNSDTELGIFGEYNFVANKAPTDSIPAIGIAYRILENSEEDKPDAGFNEEITTSEIDVYFVLKKFHWSYNSFSTNYRIGYRMREIEGKLDDAEYKATHNVYFFTATISYYFDRLIP